MSNFTIQDARPEDCEILWDLIRGLAEYEHLEHQCVGSADLLRESLFGAGRVSRAVIGWVTEDDGTQMPVGFALYFFNYSTFLTRKGLYLEDLFVIPEARHKGYGKKLMRYLASKAKSEGCGRFEWTVLDWNTPAIEFYESLGAKVLQEWRICRMDSSAIEAFAKE